jgi:hypothetical protein
MTFDTHLINMALVSLGITVGVAVLMAVAIIGISAVQLRGKTPKGGRLTLVQSDVSALSGRAARKGERESQAA